MAKQTLFIALMFVAFVDLVFNQTQVEVTDPQPLNGTFRFLPVPERRRFDDDIDACDDDAAFWPFPGYVTPTSCRRCFRCYDCIARQDFTGELQFINKYVQVIIASTFEVIFKIP